MVVGGVHGDEPAGDWAAYEVHHWPLRRGKLIVLPRANAPGIKEHLHGLPDANQLVQRDKKATVGNLDRQFPAEEGTPLPVDHGPILLPAHASDLPEFLPLATFRTEVAEHGTPKGVMIGLPAIVASRFGKGRILCFSPHPDQTKGLEGFVRQGVRWAAKSG